MKLTQGELFSIFKSVHILRVQEKFLSSILCKPPSFDRYPYHNNTLLFIIQNYIILNSIQMHSKFLFQRINRRKRKQLYLCTFIAVLVIQAVKSFKLQLALCFIKCKFLLSHL